MKDNNGLEGSVEIGGNTAIGMASANEPTTGTFSQPLGQERKYSKDDLRQAFVTGYWLHLDSDNNDLRTRVDKFEKWFNERFGG